ncbi:hypothetical protein [Undibacterium sp.]|uniref:hypothetical protein n=1 Tax=Undibacterium sp. TaxID=1914977 RepID=UPI0025DCF480|nr:hypothetical protein [Undibacterium sp.]
MLKKLLDLFDKRDLRCKFWIHEKVLDESDGGSYAHKEYREKCSRSHCTWASHWDADQKKR